MDNISNYDVNSNRHIFESLKRHTDKLRRERKHKELLRDYFIVWCFFTASQMRKRNEISRADYISYLFAFMRYCNMRNISLL